MNYYEKLRKVLEKGNAKRITNLDTGDDCIIQNDIVVLKTDNYKPSANSISELVALRPSLILFGFGHIGKALYNLSKPLGFPIYAFDDRKEILKNIENDILITIDNYENIFKKKYDFINPYFLIFTHGHKADEEALYYVLTNYESRYVGMIGSRKKIDFTYSNLEKRGLDRSLLESVHAPIGLDINAESPEEIAISIMAEIIKCYRENKNIITIESEDMRSFESNREKAIIARIIRKEGSGPRNVGSEMMIREKDALGTIGGGRIETESIKIAREMLKNDESFKILHFELKTTSPLEMACGGDAEILFKRI